MGDVSLHGTRAGLLRSDRVGSTKGPTPTPEGIPVAAADAGVRPMAPDQTAADGLRSDGMDLRSSSPFDWMADPGEPDPADPERGRVAERLALARVTQGLIGRHRWPALGRYEIIRRLGSGAFGSVLLARDPKLDRDVAIKIVSLPSGDHAAARQRVTREARALAALTHPGVVQVYDFGLVQDAMCRDRHGDPGALFIVMEYLRGQSLRAWLSDAATAPNPAEVLRVFDRVAAALAAVHDAGLVHRDVKPDNIVMTLDGTPKLVDFGLVRTQGAHAADLEVTEPMVPRLNLNPNLIPEDLTPAHGTALGTVIGTPQYMAPEQHQGRLATQACDQFALAAALFEALAGRLPFAGADLAALLAHKQSGALPVPKRPIAPAVLAVVRRGLSADPAQRFASVEHFRQALVRAATGRRRARWAAAAFGLAAVGPLAVMYGGGLRGSAPLACPGGPFFSETLFSLAQTRPPPGADARDAAQWAPLTASLETYAQRWATAKDAVCRDAPAPDPATQSRRIACLEHAAVQARTWVDAAWSAEGVTPVDARQQLARLPDPAACTDAPDDLLGLDAEQRAVIADLERRLHTLEARIRLDVTPDVVDQALATLREARATGHLPLIAHGLDVAGRLQLDLGRFTDADVTLTEAVWTALSAQRASRAALVMPRLLFAREQAAGPAGLDELVPVARRVLDEANAPPALRARVGVAIGFNLVERSRLDDALVELQSVKVMLERAGATQSTDYAEALTALSTVARNQGRLDDALALAATALAVFEAVDGPTASTTAFSHERLGAIHHARGEHTLAAQCYETSIGLLEATYGPQHPDLAWPKLILAMVWAEQGRLDEAAEVADWAMKTAVASVGETSEMIAVMAFNRSIIAEKRDNLEAALALVQRSRDISVAIAGPNSQDVADADRRIGRLLIAQGKHEAALTVLTRTRAAYEAADKTADVAECRWLIARAYAGLGRRGEAVQHARLALDALPPAADERAEVEAFLAQSPAYSEQ